MNQRTSKFRLPQLRLAQKGIIIVVIPLIVQGAVYFVLKAQLAETEAQANQAELRREIVSGVNTLFLDGFNAFQSMVNHSVYGGSKYGQKRDQYMRKVREGTDALALRLERDAKEPDTAALLRKDGRNFSDKFEELNFKIDRENQGLSLFENVEANEKFKNAAIGFMLRLRIIGIAQQAKLAPEATTQQALRADFQRKLDGAMGLSAFFAVFFGLFFLRGTVRDLHILRANASRFAQKEMLLPPLEGGDEVGEVDRVFHDMANALTAAQVKEHEMLDQLQAGKDRLDLVIENIPIAVVVTDENGIIQSFNSSAEKMFLFQREQIEGKPLTMLFSNVKTENASALLAELSSSNSTDSKQLDAISAEKEVIPAEVSVTHFDSAEGLRYLATIKDISERFRLEQLRRDFYAMVSHDIRTPLSSINGILQLVQRGRYGEISDEVDSKLNTAEKNVDKILELVSKLLEIEKLESDNIEFSINEVKVSDLMKQSIESAGQFAEAHKVTLESKPSDLQINADSLYIGNVLTNLVSNAIKFSPENSKVMITAEETDGFVEISVTDEGPGVPTRMHSQIFEKYRQVKTSRDRAKGFGLGLAICKSIVELHGGTIGVDSREGSGSRFWFKLPKAKSVV